MRQQGQVVFFVRNNCKISIIILGKQIYEINKKILCDSFIFYATIGRQKVSDGWQYGKIENDKIKYLLKIKIQEV